VSQLNNDCVAWGHRQLNCIGHAGPIATFLVKQRAWSTVWTLENASGRFYLKQAAPGFDVEATLLSALCSWRPSSIVELLAADSKRGWLLTRDAGRMLHDVMFDEPENGRAQVRSILLAYAELQVACLQPDAPPFDEVLEDRSPATMAQSFAAVVRDDALLRHGGSTSGDFEQRNRRLQKIEQLCRELATLALPLTLEHGDLHTSNIMISVDGTPRIADWGDACWTTPLHGLVMCMDDIAGRHKIGRDDPWFGQLIEDHIDAWRRAGSNCDFHRAMDIIRALVPVSGVLQWSRGIDRMPTDARKLMASHIVKHLRALG
jgi:Phosphotransferase enzyme family